MYTEAELNKEITKQSYQATAHEYAHNVADLAPRESIEKFIRLLPKHPKIIDLGCGSGRDAKLFTDLGAEVLGIDFCSKLIDIAQTQAPKAQFQLMDLEAISLPLASFDGAWAACSLGHIPKAVLLDVLKNIYSLLKNQGYFYLALKKGSGEKLEKDLRYLGNFEKFWAYFEEDELKKLLHEAQFTILDFATVDKNHSYQTHLAFRVFCQKN